MIPLQNIGVQLRLLAALGHIHAGALGLDHRQRLVGVIIEHIIHIPHLASVGHPGQFHLIDPIPSLRPARIQQHGVDVDLAGLVLAEIQRFRHILRLLFSPASGQLLPQSGVFRHELLQLYFSFRVDRRGSGRLVLQK